MAKKKIKQEEIKAAEVLKHEPVKIVHLHDMYQNWFLDYASYVILERAVPHINDGLKPVQRRILHSMWEMEDGRYNKVANVIGNTMKYHPHGDASIGDAMVQLGQKDILIDTQGNWGNIFTGDSAAAPRYIEARLSKFALEVVFNSKTTEWQSSYDGRNKEPVTLPVKFPLLLAQGVEGIAVGLACKILPHNFCELIEASIDVLRKEKINLLPDFPTGGIADFSKYNEGIRGGRIRIRAKIDQRDKKTLVITEVPFGTTTTSLIESILAANEKGKIKVKKVEDNTAAKVEIVIHLHPDSSEDVEKTIDALFAFTDCEITISPNSCVIVNDKPVFLSVNDILKYNTDQTLSLLKRELEIKKAELEEEWHFTSLVKIFIEKRIYRSIEDCTTWESVLETIDKGLKPYKKKFLREITTEDIIGLTEIKIKRISKYDVKEQDEKIKSLEAQIKDAEYNLSHIKQFTINYYKELLRKYGKGRERKTKIKSFEQVIASEVMIDNQKLYVNRDDGFAGFSLKKDEFVSDCSDLDEIIVFRGDGTMIVTKVDEKKYVGKDVRHIALFRKTEEQPVYNIIYQDGRGGSAMLKRFTVGGTTRDKEYILTKGKEGSKVLWFSLSGEKNAESVRINFRPKPKMKLFFEDVNFNNYEVKGRDTIGITLTKNMVNKITKLSEASKEKPAAKQLSIDQKQKRENAKVTETVKPAAKIQKKVSLKIKPETKDQKPVGNGKKKTPGHQKPKPKRKMENNSQPGKKIKPVKEEPPMTMEWDFTEEKKVQNDRAKILKEEEQKSSDKPTQTKLPL
jgi:topoisomerase-4 subunit A